MSAPSLSLNEFVQLDRPHVNWLIPQLLPKPGFFLLLGPPKIGKSRFALQLGLSVAQCTPVLGHQPIKAGRVLFLQFDTSEMVWRDMLLKIQEGGTSLAGPIYTMHPDKLKHGANLESPEVRATLRGVLEDTGPDLVILDVLRELHTEDENDSGAMKRVVDRIMGLFAPYTVVLIHHSRKIDPRFEHSTSPVQASRGSSYLTGRADGFFYLTSSSLTLLSRFNEEKRYDARLGEDGLWVLNTPQIELVQELCTHNPTLSHSTIYNENVDYLTSIGISKSTYYRLIGRVKCCHQKNHPTG